jgi:hypothetical protein
MPIGQAVEFDEALPLTDSMQIELRRGADVEPRPDRELRLQEEAYVAGMAGLGAAVGSEVFGSAEATVVVSGFSAALAAERIRRLRRGR